MTKKRNAAVIPALVAVSAATAFAGPVATIVVETGRTARTDTPVSAELPKVPASTGPFHLAELRGGKSTDVPCQVAGGRVYWIVSGKTPAGAKRTYLLQAGRSAAAATAMKAEKSKDYLQIVRTGGGQGTKVLRYYHSMLAPPKGVSGSYTRSAFIHPVWSTSGHVLTDNFPKDHLHHKGVWMPWTKTKFRGKDVDFWNLKKRQGTVRFAAYASVDSGPVFAGFTAHHEHVVLDKKGRDAAIALNETWELRAWNVGGPEKGYWLWDLKATQRCATDSPLELGRYHYGGLGFRGSSQWAGKDAYYLTSEGKDRSNGHGTRAKWCAMGGKTDGRPVGVAVLGHPKNFRFPEPMRIWGGADQKVFFCYAPEQLGKWKINPGRDYVWRYRFVAYEGKALPRQIERCWQDFGNPPKVTVSASGK